jgi:glycosyltransferase involved in cell wall biosynthesis
MRVAYVTPYYNGSCDGRFGRFHDWIHWGRDRGSPFEFDIYAFTASNPDSTLVDRPHGYFGDAATLWGIKKNKPEFLLNIPRIRRALKTHNYDIVHVMTMDTIVYPTVVSAVEHCPIIIGPDIAGWSPVRDVPYWEQGFGDWVDNRWRYLLKNTVSRVGRYDHAVAFSDHHRDILVSFGIPEQQITVLPPGVNAQFTPDSRDQPSEPPELLFVGDFSEHKGYPHFLQALTRIDRSFEVRLAGAGDPNKERIAELGLSDIVSIEGFVSRSELPALYNQSDLVVIPTIDETAGTNVQFEALASGKPVVVTDKPGVSEFTPLEASVTFAPRTVSNLADALSHAIDDLDSLTAASRRLAPDFGADKTLERLNSVYERTVAEYDTLRR